MKSAFSANLMRWNREGNARSMPWKGEKDPYKIWLSEVILQQTRVDQGLKYYERFVRCFPTIKELALATDQEVYKMWEGLGYYTRCKNLLQTARMIFLELDGIFPATYSDILKLKGIGSYTAAAISSFAFNEPHAVVDGNVQRVLARYFGITTPVDTMKGKRFYQGLAHELLDKKKPGIYNQAIMDFGATICKPQNPLCEECIQRPDCVAFNKGFVSRVPVKEKALQRKTRWLYYFLIQVNDKVYIRKRSEKDIWENLHEFVLLESQTALNTPLKKYSFLNDLFRGDIYEISHISKTYKQVLTHQNIHGQFIVLKAKSELIIKGYTLVKKDTLALYAFPRLINKFLSEIAV